MPMERMLRCSWPDEESSGQLQRNMRSIGIDLEPWVKKDLLHFHASRASIYGLEMHLATIHKLVRAFQPRVVVMDAIGCLAAIGTRRDSSVMLTRLIDFFKMQEITALLTSLRTGNESLEQANEDISSLVDTWLLLRDLELEGERNRVINVLKSRGMAHSNQLREFLLTDHGVELQDVYLGAEGVLTGSARLARESTEKAAILLRHQEVEAKQRERELKREALEARIVVLQKEFEAEEELAKRVIDQEQSREETHQLDRDRMGVSRQGDKVLKDVEPSVRSTKTPRSRP